jgi:pimeloyl-ACP methyl ester carboxylesterase
MQKHSTGFDIMRLLQLILVFCLMPAMAAAQAWQTLPPTPAPIPAARTGHAAVNGIRIYYAVYGQGQAVILLHGGLGNADYWGKQIEALSASRTVIAMDSRGHGRSTRDAKPFSYGLMADDVVALMDFLGVPKADLLGWSDGAVVALDMAMRHAGRVGKAITFAGNTNPSGLKGNAGSAPAFAAYIQRAHREYAAYSPAPKDYAGFVNRLRRMWGSEPNWTDARLKSIETPVLVVCADHDEVIKRQHAEYIAATIPGAKLVIIPHTSHFAFLQDPGAFNQAILRFLGDR